MNMNYKLEWLWKEMIMWEHHLPEGK